MKKLLIIIVLLVAIPAFAQAPEYRIPIQWNAVTDPSVTELRIYEFDATSNRTLLATVAPTETEYIVQRVAGEYNFAVIAFNGFWENPDFDIITTPDIPPKVEDVRFGAILEGL